MMKIVHVVSSLNIGGMEHFVLRIAQAQQQKGCHVTVVALQGGPLEAVAGEHGLPVVVLGGRSKFRRVLRGLGTLARLRPDIVNGHNETSLHYAVLARRVSPAKVVLTNHGQGAGKAHNPNRREWKDVDTIVAVSDAVARGMNQARFGSKLRTIANGVQFQVAQRSRAEVREEFNLPADRVVGVIVARIDALKGHDTLLHAAAKLHAQNLPLTLLVVGDGAERQNRERLAVEIRSGDVRFCGFRNDVPDLLAASDFFVLPSLTEGLPLSILEAMSHGLPTVATDVGGIPELITDREHGLLVPAGDASALAAALTTVIDNKTLRVTMGTAAAQRVKEEFSFSRMTESYDSLYRGLLGNERLSAKKASSTA